MINYIKKAVTQGKSEEQNLKDSVQSIISNVIEKGDQAIFEYSKAFDSVELDTIKVSADSIDKAKKQLPLTLLEDMKFSIERIKSFAELQRNSISEFENEMIPGVFLGQKVIPIESVGAYVPGGRYPLLSSAQMAIIPAKVAGVEKVQVCTPPMKNGEIHPAVLVAASLSGADEIFSVGGAQAIAALAYGTESISPVNKITGPGNRFVTEAKKQVHGKVGIDLLAGPSEVLVLADEDANPKYIASDLLAQSEHDIHAQGILVTNSETLALAVQSEIDQQLKTLPTAEVARVSWETRGQIILTSTLDEAIEVTNDLASEHLHVQIKDAASYLNRLTNYGSLFLGENASVVYADKVCGTNHILPTNEAAKYTGGVWVGTFLKVVTYQRIEQAGIDVLAPHCVRQSYREGLIGHLRSANVRLTGELDAEKELLTSISKF
ncbi:histidinol dehydrogenase [Psychrobacillus soli]|uniref:Histidinol dehydrogenase n=2 Tax=Psychrobacillus soli TaxID=1543965 RepID=A0A544T4D3_9BACI|nr:histidinol dehydrogenase [Psychrobacillus soli]